MTNVPLGLFLEAIVLKIDACLGSIIDTALLRTVCTASLVRASTLEFSLNIHIPQARLRNLLLTYQTHWVLSLGPFQGDERVSSGESKSNHCHSQESKKKKKNLQDSAPRLIVLVSPLQLAFTPFCVSLHLT